jgi:predicted phage-related endonuclease
MNELGGRAGTIGGSLVAQILGLCPYGSPHDAWVRIVHGRDIPDNEAMARGRRLEPWIAQVAAERLKMEVKPPFQETGRFTNEPRLSFSIDFEAYDLASGMIAGLVEIKTANNRKRWPSGGHPFHRLQLQHYLAARDLDVGYLVGVQASEEVFRFIHSLDHLWYAIENNCAQLHVEEVPRDPRYTSEVIPALLEWFDRYVVTKTPPPVDGSAGCTEALRITYSEREGEIEACEAVEGLAVEHQQVKREIDQLKARKSEIENELRAQLAGHRVAKSDAARVTISHQQGRLRFNSKAFQGDHPELHSQYMDRGSAFDRITVKVVNS